MAGQYSTSTTGSDLEHILLDETAKPEALPFPLLRKITNGFSDEQEIGSGGFATVYKGTLENGTVAVKKLHTYMHEKEFIREVECLMMARHKNVVRFLGYCSDTQGSMEMYEGKWIMAEKRQRLLCFKFVPKGDLHKYIKDASCGLDWTNRYRIIEGIVEGLHYLHKNDIVHLDLKPQNILLDHNMVPKITDFGLSRYFDEQQSKLVASKVGGTIGYLAPEYDSSVITRKYDMYSLGVIITEILTGRKGHHTVENVLESWRNRLEISIGDAQLDQVRICAEIGIECYKTNPSNRPTTQEILDRLNKTENVDVPMKTGLITSSKLQDENGRRRPLNRQYIPEQRHAPEFTEHTDLMTAHLGEVVAEIDSAFRSSRQNEVYMFIKGEYVLLNYAPGSLDDRIIYGPQHIVDGFRSLVGTAFAEHGIDASFGTHVEDEAIIFSKNLCARINFAPRTSEDKIIDGEKTITQMFPFFKGTNFEKGIDTAFESTLDGEAYLFKGTQYARVNYAKPSLLTIAFIVDGFECLRHTEFDRDIGAAFASHRPNRAYLFKGNRYIVLYFTPADNQDRILSGPKEIVPTYWPSLTNVLLCKHH